MKCNRCGRRLLRALFIAGGAYGPVCAREMGYRQKVVRRFRAVAPVPDERQAELFVEAV